MIETPEERAAWALYEGCLDYVRAYDALRAWADGGPVRLGDAVGFLIGDRAITEGVCAAVGQHFLDRYEEAARALVGVLSRVPVRDAERGLP